MPWWPDLLDLAGEAPRDAWRGLPWHDALFVDPGALARAGRAQVISTEMWVVAAQQRLVDGKLRLDGLVPLWSQDVLSSPGTLIGLWRPMLAMAAMLCECDDEVPGVAQLLHWLTVLVREVPQEEAVLPAELLAFARSSGTTRSHRQAKLLVDVVAWRRGE